MFKDEIVPFTNKDGYVNGSICSDLGRVSDNSIMFTAEYYVNLKLRGESTQEDSNKFYTLCKNMLQDGVLLRYPGDTVNVEDSPDNWMAFINGCFHYGYKDLLRSVLWHGLTHWGCFSPNDVYSGQTFIWRFPQILLSLVTALGLPSILFPVHVLATAVGIFLSGRNEPITSTDSRRLAWHTIHVSGYTSLLCRLASLVWLKRLRADYSASFAMRKVYEIYFNEHQTHPFRTYFMDAGWEL